MSVWFVIGAVVWVLCGVLGFGATLAYFQGQFKQLAVDQRRQNLAMAWMIALIGPFGLVVNALLSERFRFGFNYKTWTYDEAVAHHREAYPSLPVSTSREDY